MIIYKNVFNKPEKEGFTFDDFLFTYLPEKQYYKYSASEVKVEVLNECI